MRDVPGRIVMPVLFIVLESFISGKLHVRDQKGLSDFGRINKCWFRIYLLRR